jgi:hypothetical protein
LAASILPSWYCWIICFKIACISWATCQLSEHNHATASAVHKEKNYTNRCEFRVREIIICCCMHKTTYKCMTFCLAECHHWGLPYNWTAFQLLLCWSVIVQIQSWESGKDGVVWH